MICGYVLSFWNSQGDQSQIEVRQKLDRGWTEVGQRLDRGWREVRADRGLDRCKVLGCNGM